jgi:hypothetical protein
MTIRDEILRAEFIRIAESRADGKCPPEVVVQEATPVDSPLHQYFEWDDALASHQYRVWQARQLLGSVNITFQPPASQPDIPAVVVREFVSLTPDRHDGGGYRSITAVMAQPELQDQLLADALAEMQRFIAKYQTLAQLSHVIQAMQSVLSEQPA